LGMVSGTCEKIGFTDFSTMHFQYVTRLKRGSNSIFSHVPGTISPNRALTTIGCLSNEEPQSLKCTDSALSPAQVTPHPSGPGW
ncbi:MAG: hypothetical protein WAO35_07875, partial [Terriglobia bacterium]